VRVAVDIGGEFNGNVWKSSGIEKTRARVMDDQSSLAEQARAGRDEAHFWPTARDHARDLDVLNQRKQAGDQCRHRARGGRRR